MAGGRVGIRLIVWERGGIRIKARVMVRESERARAMMRFRARASVHLQPFLHQISFRLIEGLDVVDFIAEAFEQLGEAN